LDIALSLTSEQIDTSTTSLATKPNQADVDAELALKANQTFMDTAMALKANQADVDTALPPFHPCRGLVSL
jgi:hypothetical protein